MYNGTQSYTDFLQNSTSVGDVPADWDEGLMQKAQYDTTTEAHVNAIFQAALYAQYNQENNFYGAMPKVDRFEAGTLDGSVTAKAYRAAHSPVPLQTHPEGGEIPEGEKFEVEEVEFDPKRSETVAEVSDLQDIRAAIDDSVGFSEFWELQQDQLDLAIDRNAIGEAVTAGEDQYEDRDEITELDRAIASGDEEANAQDPDATAYNPGDLDYGNVVRAEDSWADAFVDFDDTETRQLNEDLFNTFLNQFNEFADVNPYQNSIILTGHDSARVLSDLAADRQNVRTQQGVVGSGEATVNDAETITGLTGTGRFREYDGIPIVANQHAPSHGDLSSIYIVPTDTINGEPRMAVENFMEPYMEMAGRGQAQGYFATGEYREKALMKLDHELVVRDFSSTAKLRDLSA